MRHYSKREVSAQVVGLIETTAKKLGPLPLLSLYNSPCQLCNRVDRFFYPVSRIRIHWVRIQIRCFRDQNLGKNLQLKKFTFLVKNCTVIYLFLGLHKGRSSYWRSLQPSKENIQQFKTWNFFTFFLFLWVIFQFCPPGSWSTDLIESGSLRDPNPDPKHCFFLNILFL